MIAPPLDQIGSKLISLFYAHDEKKFCAAPPFPISGNYLKGASTPTPSNQLQKDLNILCHFVPLKETFILLPLQIFSKFLNGDQHPHFIGSTPKWFHYFVLVLCRFVVLKETLVLSPLPNYKKDLKVGQHPQSPTPSEICYCHNCE